MPIYAEKICDMRTLLNYAKNAATCEICGNRIFAKKTDMDIYSSSVQFMRCEQTLTTCA